MSMLSPEDRRIDEAVRRVLADPLSWPKEMKEYIGRYLELDQPSFSLRQMRGWQEYVGNNDSAQCSEAITLTTTAQTITGCSLDLVNAGSYIVHGIFDFESVDETTTTLPADVIQFPDGLSSNWDNEDNALLDDGNLASTTLAAGETGDSHHLNGSYAFDVYPGASITRVQVLPQVADNGTGSGSVFAAQLIVDGSPAGDIVTQAIADGAAMAEYTLNGTTDSLWGTDLTAGDLNGDGGFFGVQLQVTSLDALGHTVSLDCAKIKVFGTNTWGFATGYLYVDSDPEDQVVIAPSAAFVDGEHYTASGSWFIQTTGAATITLRAKKQHASATVEADTGSTITAIRIN